MSKPFVRIWSRRLFPTQINEMVFLSCDYSLGWHAWNTRRIDTGGGEEKTRRLLCGFISVAFALEQPIDSGSKKYHGTLARAINSYTQKEEILSFVINDLSNVRAAYVCSSMDRAILWLRIGCGFESRQAYAYFEAPGLVAWGFFVCGGGDFVGTGT